jgi:hypothetical protein
VANPLAAIARALRARPGLRVLLCAGQGPEAGVLTPGLARIRDLLAERHAPLAQVVTCRAPREDLAPGAVEVALEVAP